MLRRHRQRGRGSNKVGGDQDRAQPAPGQQFRPTQFAQGQPLQRLHPVVACHDAITGAKSLDRSLPLFGQDQRAGHKADNAGILIGKAVAIR